MPIFKPFRGIRPCSEYIDCFPTHPLSNYTQKEIGMLYCVVGKYQLMKVKSIVKEIDPMAFMIVNQVHEVIGKGFLGQ